MADNKNINTTEGTESTKVEKTTKSKDAKPNIFVRAGKWIVKFLKDTKGELKKVVWTSKSELAKSTKLVIVTVLAICVVVALIDLGSSWLINAVAGLIG